MSVSIPVRLEAGDELTGECVAADVYFGDDKLSSAAVNTSVSAGGAERIVRVSTTSLINEPVVTVYLAAGCKAKITRKFVAFADPPGIVMLPTQSADGLSTTPALSASKSLGSRVAPDTSPSAVSSGVADASIRAAALSGVDASARASADGQATDQTRAARREARRAAARERARAAAREAAREAAANGSATEQGLGASADARAAIAAAAPAVQADAGAQAQTQTRTQTRTSDRSKRKPERSPLDARLDNRPRAAETSRLVLDPVEADAVVAPVLMMSSGMGAPGDIDSPEATERRAAAAALWAAMNASPEQLARDRQRMQDLEQRLARLQQESAGAQKKVAEMEARVRDAQMGRSPLVYALGGLSVLLAAALGWMLWRQRRQPEQASWWQGDASPEGPDTAPTAMAEPALARTNAGFKPVEGAAAALPTPAAPASAQGSQPAAGVTAPAALPAVPAVSAAPMALAGRADPSLAATQPMRVTSEAQESTRALTVEELIDLEQQAEFFVVLGQDEAAIELLESHVHTTAGASPLPYLKLLEIYQRLGRRTDYERVQQAFNGRFNAYAPSWESDLQQGHSLQDYPGVVERLQALWSQPAQAMEVLQVSLTRPDATVETFDLPAYRELLFLYGVARDLSDRESQDRQPVDLHAAGGAVLSPPTELSIEPLMATRPVKALPQATPSLSLDLSLDDPVPSGPGGFVDEPMTHMDIDLGADVQEPGALESGAMESGALDSHGRADAQTGQGGVGQGGMGLVPMDLPPKKS